jgi:hypothetical protein
MGQDSIYLSLKICTILSYRNTEPSAHNLSTDSSPSPFVILDPSVNQTSPLTTGGVPGPLVHSSLVTIVTLGRYTTVFLVEIYAILAYVHEIQQITLVNYYLI